MFVGFISTKEPEAERFARIAMSLNVPRESILIEAHSTNTGENIAFTKTLLADKGLNPQRFIIVQGRSLGSVRSTPARRIRQVFNRATDSRINTDYNPCKSVKPVANLQIVAVAH
jgi:hypothetical protein